MTRRTYTIGEVSRLSGVPIRRLRFYADQGVLPTAGRTEAGYRIFDDAGLVRLDLIRSLRLAGIGLSAIREVLAHAKSMDEVLALRLAEIDAQIVKQRSIAAALRAALRSSTPLTDDDLRRVWIMTGLSTEECSAVIDGFLNEVAKGGTVDPRWKERIAILSKPDLPAEPTTEQIDAWIELREMLSNPTFVQQMRENARDSFGQGIDAAIFDEVQNRVLPQARAALSDGQDPDSDLGRRVAKEYLEGWARALHVDADALYWERMRRKHFLHKPNTDRYWHLIHTIGGMKPKGDPDDAWMWIDKAANRLLAEM